MNQVQLGVGMQKRKVSIVRYEKPLESVKKTADLADGLGHLPARAKVFIKPNIVFWTRAVPFPKWGGNHHHPGDPRRGGAAQAVQDHRYHHRRRDGYHESQRY